MLVRASLISALLLSLVAEAGAQDRALKSAENAGNAPRPPENGVKRAPGVEDLFGASGAPRPPVQSETIAQPDAPQLIRSSKQRVDENGLRYFASQHNQKRVEKEIQRLKALYPEWTPPDDIFLGPPGGPEEQPFWDLFAQDKVQEMRAGIAEKMKVNPKWKPSAALIYKLERKESRIKLVAAYEQKQWRKVIEVAAADPKILTCSDMDVQWKVADAFAASGQKPQAFEVYRFVLANCRDKTERLTTVRKSLAYFEPREVDILVAMGARYEDGTSEFDDVRIDVMRIRLGRLAAGTATERVGIEDLAFFERRTKTGKASADASLLGWFRLKEKDYLTAIGWFTQAMEWPPQRRDDGSIMEQPEKMVEGRILALKGLEKFDEAEALATEWAGRSDAVRALYIDIVGDALLRMPPNAFVAEERLQRFTFAVGALRSRFGAQAIGWYQFNRAAWSDAVPWFQAALAWVDPEPAAAPAAESKTAAAADTKPKDANKQTAQPASQPGPSAKPAETKAPDTKAAETKAAPAPIFTAADDAAKSIPPETIVEGLTVALRNAFRFDEAEDIAYEWRAASPRVRRLYIDVFAESLVRQNAPLVFAPERLERYAKVIEEDRATAGAQGLAWYHHDRSNWQPAVGWFKKAMDWSVERNAKLAEGYSQSLRKDGQFGPASDVAYDWRDDSTAIRGMFFDISAEHLSALPVTDTLPKEKMTRLSGLVTQDHSTSGASALGWHSFDRKNFSQSLEWFKTGLDYKPEGEQLAKMREGYVLSLRYVNRIEEAEDRAYEWRETSTLLANVYVDIVADALGRLKPPATMADARLARFVGTVNTTNSAFGAQAIGWYFQQRGQHALAADWFGQSLAWVSALPDTKTAQGYLLALISLGRFDDADKLALEWHSKSDEFRRLYIDTFGGTILQTDAAQAFPPQMLQRYEQIAAFDRSAYGAQVLGWYNHARKDFEAAARWFEASLAWSPVDALDPKTIEGFAQAVKASPRRDELEDMLYAWREKNPALRRAYGDLVAQALAITTPEIAVPDARIDRYAALVLADRDWNGAQSLAWYRLQRRQSADAVRWFKYAREWLKLENRDTTNEDSQLAEGLVNALRGLELYDEGEAVAVAWKDRSPALRRLYIETIAEYLGRLKRDSIYPTDRMERFLQTISKDVNNNGAQAAGWYFYEREMFEPAAEWFKSALKWGPDPDRDQKTALGYVEALRRNGKLAEAEQAAWDWVTRSDAFQKIYVNIAAEVIAAMKPPETFDAAKLTRLGELTKQFKSTNGAVGFGWYHQARQQYTEAAWWFERTLEWSGEIEDVRAVEGYMIALVGIGKYEEAEALALKWRERSDKISKLYIDVLGGVLLRLPKDRSVPDERLAKFQFIVGEEKSMWGAQAAGWYYIDRKKYVEAAHWFEASLSWTKDAYDGKTVEGFTQSIRYFARRDEAEEHAYAWRDKSPDMRRLFIELFSEGLSSTTWPVFLADDRIDRFAKVILDDKNSAAALGLAWYRHGHRQWADAVRWFKYAREWHVDENGVQGKGTPNMAEGLADALRNLDLYDESEQVSVEWKDTNPNLRKFYIEAAGEYIVRLKPAFAYANDRMRRFLETVINDRNNAGAVSAGWYYYTRDMFEPASEWFLAALTWGPDVVRDPSTAVGYVTSLRRLGRLAEAEVAAYELRDRSPAMKDLYFEIAGEVLAAMKPPATLPEDRLNRFIAMSEDARSMQGALAIAWYMQARENWRDAAAWFERALSWSDGNVADPKVAEGYLVALVGLSRYEEAEALVQSMPDGDLPRTYLAIFGASLHKMVPTQHVPVERLDRFATYVGLEKSASGAQSLAWYHFERRSFADAARWFQTALTWTQSTRQDPALIEGFAQALRNSGRREDAEDLLYVWRAHSASIAQLYLDTVGDALFNQDPLLSIPDRRIDRFAHIVLSERSMNGAQALAWYRFNRRVWPDAVRWFKSARAWSPDGVGTVNQVEGLALALRKMELYDESEALTWDLRDRFPTLRPVYLDTASELLGRLKNSETYPLDRMSRLQATLLAERAPASAQAVGWYFANRKNFADAAKWFRNALDWAPEALRDPGAAEGMILALRNLGRLEEAEQLAYAWRGKLQRFAKIYAEVAGESLGRGSGAQSISAERLSRYVAYARDTRDPTAAQTLGWYKAGRAEWSEAADWFKSGMDWTGDEKDPKTIEGYILSLRNLGRNDEAEALAFAWRDRGEAFSALYVDAVIDELQRMKPEDNYPVDRLGAFAKMAIERQHAAAASALGWYRLARNDDADGEAWFRNAIRWSGEQKDAKAVEGLTLALKKQQKFAEAEQTAFDQMGRSEDMRALYRQSMIEQMVATKPPATVPPDRLKKFIDYTQQSKHGESARGIGWYYYDRKEWQSALQWFKSGSDWEKDSKSTKSLEGYALTLKAMGKIEDAEAFAFDNRDRSEEMRNLYIDLVPEMLAKIDPAKTFPVDRLNRFATLVSAAKSAYGAQSLAWYRYLRNDHAQALVWFRQAIDWSGEAKDPKTVEGYVLTLRATGQFDVAEQTAYEWRDRADSLRTHYIDVFAEALTRTTPPPAFAPERLARFAAVVSTDKSATGAQALGWYSFNIKQLQPARAWFEKSLQWQPSEGAAIGLAMSARAMKDNAGFANIVALYRTQFPRLMEIGQPKAGGAGAQTYATTAQPVQPGQPQLIEQVRPARSPARAPAAPRAQVERGASPTDNAACIARIEARQRAGTATAQDMVAKGWCLLNSERPQEAAAAFERGRGSKGDDAAYGAALAKLKSGETDAAAFAGEHVQSQKRRNDIGLQVLTQRIVAANRAGRHMEVLHTLDQRAAFAAETRDLAMMRGWALWNVGRKDAARRLFAELDRQLSTNDTQSALGVVNEVRGN